MLGDEYEGIEITSNWEMYETFRMVNKLYLISWQAKSFNEV